MRRVQVEIHACRALGANAKRRIALTPHGAARDPSIEGVLFAQMTVRRMLALEPTPRVAQTVRPLVPIAPGWGWAQLW